MSSSASLRHRVGFVIVKDRRCRDQKYPAYRGRNRSSLFRTLLVSAERQCWPRHSTEHPFWEPCHPLLIVLWWLPSTPMWWVSRMCLLQQPPEVIRQPPGHLECSSPGSGRQGGSSAMFGSVSSTGGSQYSHMLPAGFTPARRFSGIFGAPIAFRRWFLRWEHWKRSSRPPSLSA